MSIESLVALKDRYKDNSRPNFGTEVLNKLVDEIVALEEKVSTLEEQMANRMLCKNYKVEE